MTGPARTDLDSASAAPLHPAAREVLLAALDRGYADPRRLHRAGREARLLLDNAREATADALGVRADEVTFTPSGTHAVHLGLLGLVRGSRRGDVGRALRGRALGRPARGGLGRARRRGRRDGRRAGLRRRPRRGRRRARGRRRRAPDRQPRGRHRAAGRRVRAAQRRPALHRRLRLDGPAPPARPAGPRAAGSAHKWGGPAGVGVLLVRKRARWRNPFPGDDRIDERSTGFENVPAVLAAAASLQAVVAERDEVNARQHALVDVVRRRVAAEVPDVEVVGDPDRRLPHLVTFSCLYVDGEALVTELDRRGFGIASGSACTASTLTPSHVLEAMGVLTHGNVRLSLQRDATRADVDAFCDVLPGLVAEIRARVGL